MSSTPILTDSLVVGASATPAALDYPERDGILYDTDGTAFQIECGTDRNGPFLEPGYTATFDQCTDLCAMTPEFVGVTYHRLESPDTVPFPGAFQCDLESTIGPAINNRNIWEAKQIASTDSTTMSFAPWWLPKLFWGISRDTHFCFAFDLPSYEQYFLHSRWFY